VNKESAPSSIEAALPAPVLMLFRWPDEEILNSKKAVEHNAPIIIAPGKQSWTWIRRVLSDSWLPPTNARMHFINKEFDDRDVTHVAWLHGDYRVEVSQTASIFTIRFISQGPNSLGRDSVQRFEMARHLCRHIFKREGRLWSQDSQGAGQAVVVTELNEKIAGYSFDVAKMKVLSHDKVVIGRARSMKDEGLDPSGAPEVPSGSVRPNEDSRAGWNYWFRNVNWWNDGRAVGFYFLKVDGPGTWVPSFVGEIDKNWFHGPRDRLGRPISRQPK